MKHQGYLLLDTNWRCASGEIDIIAFRHSKLFFIEVKTRRGSKEDFPLTETISNKKEKKISSLSAIYRTSASKYLRRYKIQHVQYDLIALHVDTGGNVQLSHYSEAYGGHW
ncbi:MAG: YraN family protein [Bdellovibrionales bacterium]|nr:YraN family protein [Bdellovibrionales bacterium]